MTAKSTNAILGDCTVHVSGDVTPAEREVGWPGSAEVEQVYVVSPSGEMVDITELIHSVIARGAGVWDDLSQALVEEE
jgi:hypothetical protein